MQANGWHSDHVREHRWHTAVPTFLCGASLLLILAFHPGMWLTVVFLGIANACLLAFVTSFWAIPSAFLGESAGAASTGLINCVAMMGGFAGPSLIGSLSARSHSFHSSFVCMTLAAVVAGVAILLVRVRPLRFFSLNAFRLLGALCVKSLVSQPTSPILNIQRAHEIRNSTPSHQQLIHPGRRGLPRLLLCRCAEFLSHRHAHPLHPVCAERSRCLCR